MLKEHLNQYQVIDFFSNCLILSRNFAANSYSSSRMALSKASFKLSKTISSDISRDISFDDIELTDEFNEIFLKVRESLQRISHFEMSTGFKDV